MLYLVVMLIMGIMYQNKKFLIYAAIICVIMTLAGEAVGCVFLGWDYSKAGLSDVKKAINATKDGTDEKAGARGERFP